MPWFENNVVCTWCKQLSLKFARRSSPYLAPLLLSCARSVHHYECFALLRGIYLWRSFILTVQYNWKDQQSLQPAGTTFQLIRQAWVNWKQSTTSGEGKKGACRTHGPKCGSSVSQWEVVHYDTLSAMIPFRDWRSPSQDHISKLYLITSWLMLPSDTVMNQCRITIADEDRQGRLSLAFSYSRAVPVPCAATNLFHPYDGDSTPPYRYREASMADHWRMAGISWVSWGLR